MKSENKSGLWLWIRDVFGVNIPCKSICPHHQPPFDFVADSFFGKFMNTVALANRSGGKTTNFAILDVLNSYVFDGCETATVGAIKMQAKKCYRYFQKYIESIPDFANQVVDSLMENTVFKNGSVVEILTGTMTGVNAPHPQKVFLDEVDLMDWRILQEAFSMPISKDITKWNKQLKIYEQFHIPAQTVMTSTRKFVSGPMQKLVNTQNETKIKLYEWCIWEVVEPLPKKNTKLYKKIVKLFKDDIPWETIGRAQGYSKWEDLVSKRLLMDDEIWETQWLCKRAGRKGLVYNFDENKNWIPSSEFSLDITKDIYIGEDFGFAESHPNVVLFLQVEYEKGLPKFVTIFDEMYLTRKDDDEVIVEVEKKMEEYNIKKVMLNGYITDPHNLTSRRARMNAGFPVLGVPEDSKLGLIVNGLPIVRVFLSRGILRFTHNCVNAKSDFDRYRFPVSPDGTVGDKPKKEFDHAPDTIRYVLVKLFPQLAVQAFSGMDKELDDIMRPITAGMLSKEY